MNKIRPLNYHRIEVESFLPSGWSLHEESAESKAASENAWSATLIDGVDFEWPLQVTAKEADRLGRVEALRVAIDRVYRARLGDHTRGLGRG